MCLKYSPLSTLLYTTSTTVWSVGRLQEDPVVYSLAKSAIC